MPFRDAHEVVGKAVAYGVETVKDLSEMSLQELKQFSDVITEEVFEVLTLEGSVAARNHLGGTAPAQVKKRIISARNSLN
jgi:argininosuccinate lyase